MYNHFALNLTTHETFLCDSANTLKRVVAAHVRYERQHGMKSGKWIFAHGTNAPAKLSDKIKAHTV